MTTRRFVVAGLLLGLASAAGISAAPVAGALYPANPPPAHTGGFGEPTCHACHFDAAPNDPGGALAIRGVPRVYTPGERYRLVVVLRRADMERGGFQLAARFAEGEQAGSLRATDERAEATVAQGSGVQYLHHTQAGLLPVSGDSVRWTLEWTAPAQAGGPVTFHAAGNAANGDESQFGDWVYTDSVVTQPGRK